MSDVRKIEKMDDGSLSMSVKHGGSAAQSDLDLEQHSDDGDGYYAADIWGLHAPRSWPRRCSSVVVTDKPWVKMFRADALYPPQCASPSSWSATDLARAPGGHGGVEHNTRLIGNKVHRLLRDLDQNNHGVSAWRITLGEHLAGTTIPYTLMQTEPSEARSWLSRWMLCRREPPAASCGSHPTQRHHIVQPGDGSVAGSRARHVPWDLDENP